MFPLQEGFLVAFPNLPALLYPYPVKPQNVLGRRVNGGSHEGKLCHLKPNVNTESLVSYVVLPPLRQVRSISKSRNTPQNVKNVIAGPVLGCGSRNTTVPGPGPPPRPHYACPPSSTLCPTPFLHLPKLRLHEAFGFLKSPSHYSREQVASAPFPDSWNLFFIPNIAGGSLSLLLENPSLQANQ